VVPNDPGLMNRLVEDHGFGRVCFVAEDVVRLALGLESLEPNLSNEEHKAAFHRRAQSKRLRLLVGQHIFNEDTE